MGGCWSRQRVPGEGSWASPGSSGRDPRAAPTCGAGETSAGGHGKCKPSSEGTEAPGRPRTWGAWRAPGRPRLGAAQPAGWGAGVGRRPQRPLAVSLSWAAINRLHSSINEMEMRRRDRGALSGGRIRLLSVPGGAARPPALPTAPASGSPLGTGAEESLRGDPRSRTPLLGQHRRRGSHVWERVLQAKTVTEIAAPISRVIASGQSTAKAGDRYVTGPGPPCVIGQRGPAPSVPSQSVMRIEAPSGTRLRARPRGWPVLRAGPWPPSPASPDAPPPPRPSPPTWVTKVTSPEIVGVLAAEA